MNADNFVETGYERVSLTKLSEPHLKEIIKDQSVEIKKEIKCWVFIALRNSIKHCLNCNISLHTMQDVRLCLPTSFFKKINFICKKNRLDISPLFI